MQKIGSFKVDVLVVGGGGAGCRAAIEAAANGAATMVVSKGPIGRSGLTPMTMPGLAAVFATRDRDDSPEIHFEDTMRSGYYLSNAKIVRTFVENAPKEVLYLESLGVRFDRTETGEIEQLPLPGHSKRRACWLDDNMGRILLNALRNEMARRQVRILEDFFVIHLLLNDGRVCGAVGIHMDTGDAYAILAKAVVLATGGSEALYPFRSSTPRATADGVALALEAGAEVMDMEFMQFTPYVFVWPKAVQGVCVPADTTLMAMGAKYLNSEGERFLRRYDPERMEMTTRDIQARAMFMEIQAGRGSEHGGVYLDCRELSDYDGKTPAEIVRSQGGCVADYLLIAGVDILKQVVELAPAAHFGMGGVRTNEKAETSLPGLYAAGEVASGLHGANRLAANSMPEIFVFGHIAGREAAAFARKTPFPPEAAVIEQARDKVSNAYQLIEKTGGSILVRDAKKKLEQIIYDYFGIVRTRKGMEKGLQELDAFGKEILPDIEIKDKSKVMNYDWIEALEMRNMLEVGRVLGLGALNRKESRGAHYREDCPEMLPEWRKNTVARKQDGSIQLILADPDERW